LTAKWIDGYLDYPPTDSELLNDTVRTDAKGRFASLTVLPGTYTVMKPRGWISADSVKIAGGETRDHLFHIRRVKLRAIAKTANGELVANRRYEVRYKTKRGEFHPDHGRGITDANGELKLNPAPLYAFYLFFFEGRKARPATLRVGPLRALLDRYEDVIEVRVPAPDPKSSKK
jgi:hypothetical protein